MNSQIKVSFIVPAYNEVDNVFPFYEAFSKTFADSNLLWELIFIDDGSSDGTRGKLRELTINKPNVLAISFSRNFGKEAAIWAGLNNATGDIIGIIDADLQQDPQDALNMVDALLDNDDCDMVAAFQAHRHEGRLLSFLKRSFYSLMDSMMETPVLKDASDFRVFRRCVADTILSMPEFHRFSKGIFSWVGFNTMPYAYEPLERQHGVSKWSLFKLLQYAFSGIISFSTKPLRAASWLGISLSILSFIYFLVVMVQKTMFSIPIPGYATSICLILLIGGVQLLFLGIAGEYIGRTYIQVKSRPIYIESKRFQSQNIEHKHYQECE